MGPAFSTLGPATPVTPPRPGTARQWGWPTLLAAAPRGDSCCFHTTVCGAGTGSGTEVNSICIHPTPLASAPWVQERSFWPDAKRLGWKRQGAIDLADGLGMWEDGSLLRGFFKVLFGWAWVSSSLIKFRLCRREQKKHCLALPGPSPCTARTRRREDSRREGPPFRPV